MKKVIKIELGRTFADLTLDDWVHEGISIYSHAEHLTWQLADWAAYGDRAFGALKEFCASHGMNYQTLANYSYVAGNVEISRRRERLSFSHHIEVAPLPGREQEKWLRKAEEHNWSVAELRRQIRAGEQHRRGDGPRFDFEEKAILELKNALARKPASYWTPATREVWREKIRPILELIEGETMAPPPSGSLLNRSGQEQVTKLAGDAHERR